MNLHQLKLDSGEKIDLANSNLIQSAKASGSYNMYLGYPTKPGDSRHSFHRDTSNN